LSEEKLKTLVDSLVKIREAINELLAKITPKTLAEVEKAIPEECRDLLTYEENNTYFILKPRAYLGSENFVKVLDTVKQFGGEYISAGKNSHFRILKGVQA